MIDSALVWLFTMLSLPAVGLPAIFIISLISATLVPLGSEPAVFALVKINPDMFWPVVLVATLGNTLGGMIDYWMGRGAHQVFAAHRQSRWFGWLQRGGPKTLLLAWLPGIGDPLCAVAGWLEMPFWPCVAYMAVGKFLRYAVLTFILLQLTDGIWQQAAGWFG